MTYKNSIFSLLLFLFAYSTISSQTATNESFANHLRFGGSFNLGFGNNYTTIGISPSAIYDFNDQFSAGMSLSYMYSKGKYYIPNTNNTYEASSNIIGGSLIALYNPFYGLQVSAELEQMHVNYKNDAYQVRPPYWSPAVYLGLAYNTGNISFGLRYDILYNTNKSIYGSPLTPVFRVYF